MRLLIIKKNTARVGILREQGVNGHKEMAAAFFAAGFEPIDIHMTDILSGEENLESMIGLAVCGGFSYGDVMGAGRGWASTIQENIIANEVFREFFKKEESFTLGVCNGCQMLSHLKHIIPGTTSWSSFEKNKSGQFEARLSMVEVIESPSIFLTGLEGMKAPIVVAHSEGKISSDIADKGIECLRYIDNYGKTTSSYPANPNGSQAGITGLTSTDGRVTIMMPHPERVFLSKQFSWLPYDWRDHESPWLQMFKNARKFAY